MGQNIWRSSAASAKEEKLRKATAATLSLDRPGLLLSLSCLCEGIWDPQTHTHIAQIQVLILIHKLADLDSGPFAVASTAPFSFDQPINPPFEVPNTKQTHCTYPGPDSQISGSGFRCHHLHHIQGPFEYTLLTNNICLQILRSQNTDIHQDFEVPKNRHTLHISRSRSTYLRIWIQVSSSPSHPASLECTPIDQTMSPGFEVPKHRYALHRSRSWSID